MRDSLQGELRLGPLALQREVLEACLDADRPEFSEIYCQLQIRTTTKVWNSERYDDPQPILSLSYI